MPRFGPLERAVAPNGQARHVYGTAAHVTFTPGTMGQVSFDGAPVAITGVGRAGQVGDAVAAAFARSGARPILIGRDESHLRDRAAELQAAGFMSETFACDLTDAAGLRALADKVAARHESGIAALVNVAGGFAMSGPVAESEPALMQRQLATNLTTAYLATRAFLPLLRRARGAVVFFASEAVLPGASIAGMAAYAASKSAVVTLMRAVAEEERQHGVRANAVAPATIHTAANVAAMGDAGHYVDRDAVADAVVYLASAAAQAITGQVIHLA